MPLKDISVLERPANKTAHVGDTVTFTCRSADFPAPHVYWIRETDLTRVQEVIQV